MPVVYKAEEKRKKDKKEEKRTVKKVEKKEGEGERAVSGVLSDFQVKPKKVNFETQEAREEIILLLRQHWITNFLWIFLALVMMMVPVVFLEIKLTDFLDFLPTRFVVIGVICWYLLVYSFVLVRFINWYFNVYIVTDERIVDVDFFNLLYKQVSSTRIAKIQDVTYSVTGAFASFFNYGDVYIQTAGTEVNFEFMKVHHPAMVARVIGEMMEKEEGEWQVRGED